MINIICYTGGTCGDLVSALIDPTDVRFYQTTVVHADNRIRLKKPHLFNNDIEKDQYIDYISNHYRSIPSHDLNYHISKKHDFIGVTVEDRKTANWAARRFKRLHRQQVWEEMCKICGAETVEDYAQTLIDYSWLVAQHTTRLIKLEDILRGDALQSLQSLGITNYNKNVYRNWLDLQRNMYLT